jgi:hypothetical protein
MESVMSDRRSAVAFDVDAASLASLRDALPAWQIEVVEGAVAASLPCDWNPGAVDLLVVGVRPDVTETLGLCRFLAFCTSYSGSTRQETDAWRARNRPENRAPRGDAPILVLVPAGQGDLVEAALTAGADRCLVLPIDAGDVADTFAAARVWERPGRPRANGEGTQAEDRWRDDGGRG